MTAKEYLASISRLESFIASKKQRVEALKCMAANVSPSPITDMPKAPSKTISPMADAICKAIDIESEIKDDELCLQKKKLRLIRMFDVSFLDLVATLSDIDVQSIIIKRYFEKKQWNTIMAETFFSSSWTFKLHKAGMDELDKKLASYKELP